MISIQLKVVAPQPFLGKRKFQGFRKLSKNNFVFKILHPKIQIYREQWVPNDFQLIEFESRCIPKNPKDLS